MTQNKNHSLNKTASSQPITTNSSSSIPINPVDNSVNISLFKDSQKSSCPTALDSDGNPKLINNSGEKNPVLFLNKNDKAIAPHNRMCSIIDKLITTNEIPMICSVAETKGSYKTDSLGAEGVDYAKQPIKRFSHLTAKENRTNANKARFQKEYNKQQREALKNFKKKLVVAKNVNLRRILLM